MEDLFISKDGKAVTDVLDGFYDAGGKVPCQIDGGLKCFGHPIGASGLRMAYEVYNQLLGRAADRPLKDPTLGLTHHLGGDRKSVVWGKRVSVRLDFGGRRYLKKKKKTY